jgi:type II restriction/modification system DNA methylase subunit YeeA
LTSNTNLTSAIRLKENASLAFIGDMKKGKFDITNALAQTMLQSPPNPNGRPNSDVIRRWINGLDITQRSQNMWIIDFGVDMPQAVAAQYEQPFEYVRKHVKPDRDKVHNPLEKSRWWLHGRPAPDLRAAVNSLQRYIATARVAKHRLFVLIEANIIPDGQVVVIARQDDYFLGVLHSRPHELWALQQGTSLEDRPRYTPTTTFETFPFPWPPGHEPQDDPRVQAIANAARELVQLRETQSGTRTLTQLYNERPTWLDNAHRKLDAAVFAAYGWPVDLSEDEILARLLALNLARAAA